MLVSAVAAGCRLNILGLVMHHVDHHAIGVAIAIGTALFTAFACVFFAAARANQKNTRR